MNQKIALVVYPEFSFQEIGNLSSLFRWGFDTRTVVVSGDKNPVRSEEGFAILPDITYEEFCDILGLHRHDFVGKFVDTS